MANRTIQNAAGIMPVKRLVSGGGIIFDNEYDLYARVRVDTSSSFNPEWRGTHRFNSAVEFSDEQTFSAAGLSLPSQAEGDMLYFDGTDWQRLPAGVNNQVLAMLSGIPTWSSSVGVGAMAADYPFGDEQTDTVDDATAIPLFDGLSGRPERDPSSRGIKLCNCAPDASLIVRYGSAPDATYFAEYLAPLETRNLSCDTDVVPYILAYSGSAAFLAQQFS